MRNVKAVPKSSSRVSGFCTALRTTIPSSPNLPRTPNNATKLIEKLKTPNSQRSKITSNVHTNKKSHEQTKNLFCYEPAGIERVLYEICGFQKRLDSQINYFY